MFSISIKPNSKWKEASSLFETIDKRYEWFQFQFGRRAMTIFYKMLGDEIKKIKHAPKGYRKRLVMAEIRDTAKKSWFAVAIKAKPISKTEFGSEDTILKVISRFPDIEGFDPVRDILQEYGPWTAETIPFLPSKRFAVIVPEKARSDKVKRISLENKRNTLKVSILMKDNHIVPDTRFEIFQKLQLVEDLEKAVLEIEFARTSRSHPHWAKTIRKFRSEIVRKMMNQRDMIAAMTNSKYSKYKTKARIRNKLNTQDLRGMEKFIKRVQRQM